MRRLGATPVLVFLAASVLAAGLVPSAAAAGQGGALTGRVSGPGAPLGRVLVYAYQLADLTLQKAVTDEDGGFLFAGLPAGLYKIVAFKPGFLPAIVFLTRASGGTEQFLQLQLSREALADGEPAAEDFWSIRSRIPGDVLRDLEAAGLGESPAAASAGQPARFATTMEALAGIDEAPGLGSARRAGAQVEFLGSIRDLRVGVSGNFTDLQANGAAAGTPGEIAAGQGRFVSLNVESPGERLFTLTSVDHRSLVPVDGLGDVDLERYRVSWSQPVGGGQTDFAAQYTDESNFYSSALIVPAGIPTASRTWRIDGNYTTAFNDRSTLEAGFRYRERLADDTTFGAPAELTGQRLDLFGGGGLEAGSALRVEYGLYSTLRDGTVSLMPRGEVIVELGPRWQASVAASRKVYEDAEPLLSDFSTTLYREGQACREVEEACYQLELTRRFGDGESVSLGARHRRFDEMVRMYFSEDLFDHLESVFLVQGDELPELQLALTRRLSPTILARLESNLASGGGGIVYARRNRLYENSVQYLVTSLDTHFERTSTGVFVAFHRVEQELEPLAVRRARRPAAVSAMEHERLQVMLTQDLGLLHRLASNLAVQLNMEVSRGSAPNPELFDGDELLKQVMGGIAYTF